MDTVIVLFSGGIDSTVVLAMALDQGKKCLALSFDYGQRHKVELTHAHSIANYYSVQHKIIYIDPNSFAASSLVSALEVPKNRSSAQITASGIPSTYVPARNTLFLAFAAGQAEIYNASEIYAGPNLMDRLPYPDCRPDFFSAFQKVLNLATRQAVEGSAPSLLTPLINWDKKRILQEGRRLRAPMEMTFSCYDPSPAGIACQECDACVLRQEAFLTLDK